MNELLVIVCVSAEAVSRASDVVRSELLSLMIQKMLNFLVCSDSFHVLLPLQKAVEVVAILGGHFSPLSDALQSPNH